MELFHTASKFLKKDISAALFSNNNKFTIPESKKFEQLVITKIHSLATVITQYCSSTETPKRQPSSRLRKSKASTVELQDIKIYYSGYDTRIVRLTGQSMKPQTNIMYRPLINKTTDVELVTTSAGQEVSVWARHHLDKP